MEENELLIVYVTCSRDDSKKIAGELVERNLAACVNILPADSVYKWQGAINDDPEALLIIKTRRGVYEKLESLIKKIHPYNLPEIVALKADNVESGYLHWVIDETGGKRND